MKKYTIIFFIVLIAALIIYLLAGKKEENRAEVLAPPAVRKTDTLSNNSQLTVLEKVRPPSNKIHNTKRNTELRTEKKEPLNIASVIAAPIFSNLPDLRITEGDNFKEINLRNIPDTSNNFTDLNGINWYDKKPFRPLTNFIQIAAFDGLSFATSFTRWDSSDVIRLISISALTALLMSSDESIRNEVTKYNSSSMDDISKVSELYGRTITTELTAAAIELYGIINNDKKAMLLGFEIYESYLIADNLHKLLKYSFGRTRPNDTENAYIFNSFPSRGVNINSFPSGHATLAFSLSTVLASATDNKYLKALIYTPAFLTALSRVYDNVHWTSDIFLGSALGYFVADYLVNRHRGTENKNLIFGLDDQGRVGVKYFFK